uniref:Uncharacterized protein n=1 Tax=Ditylum brightwellii TaxID=49249 RepID=A0A7S1ZC62_9STRA|mmetsp:Transcript_28925/g.43019  ORF Transcript_28925/g.43019 Transcript_28925/m.43019 type:complete len:326 (+) Transcript_28925:55-1032(+)
MLLMSSIRKRAATQAVLQYRQYASQSSHPNKQQYRLSNKITKTPLLQKYNPNASSSHPPRSSYTTRTLSSTTTTTESSQKNIMKNAKVHIRGEKYGSREYILLPSNLTIDVNDDSDASLESTIQASKLASLRAHRNIIFGARVYNVTTTDADDEDDSTTTMTTPLNLMTGGCKRLLNVALNDAAEYGEQPQAIAALYGLCDWVSTCIHEMERERNADQCSSEALLHIIQEQEKTGDSTTYEAIKAIATGIPRPGHSVVGVGTFRDGQKGWETLATEYAMTQDGLAQEAALYRMCGGELTNVEHLADRSEDYIRSAGGAMVRFYFL